MRTRPTALALATFAATLALVPAAAAQSEADGYASNVALGDVIYLVSSDPRLRVPLAETVAMWSLCPRSGMGFPRPEALAEVSPSGLGPGEQHWRKIEVAMSDRNHPNRGSRCGTFQGDSIIVGRRTVDDLGRAHSCGTLAETLAHEIGHALGLKHATPSVVDLQGEPAMAGTILANVKRPRQVRNWECEATDLHWMTSRELAGARALGSGSPASTSDRSVDEIAAAWHEAVAMGLVDASDPVESALANESRSARRARP